jgi:hypothetical protein
MVALGGGVFVNSTVFTIPLDGLLSITTLSVGTGALARTDGLQAVTPMNKTAR